MNNEKKLTFWKKLKYSIIDFEKYQDLAAEKITKTILYIVILMIILGVVVAGIYTYKFSATIQNIREYVEDNIETIAFEDNKLTIVPKNGEKVTTIIIESIGMKVVLNTQTEDTEQIDESINDIESQENGILILSDKILVKNEIMNKPYTYSYTDLSEQYHINQLDKQKVLDLLSGEVIKSFIATFFGVMLIYMFILYLSNTLVDIVVLSIFGYIVSLITKMRLKYSAIYNIAAYSLTLSIILNIIYFIVNSFTGFTIKYFEIMYTTVATIYIATAILMIRSDVIKKQIELNKIIEEQDRVREELQRREEEKKEKEERERQKKEDEEKNRQKEKKKKEEKENLGKEPEGDNA